MGVFDKILDTLKKRRRTNPGEPIAIRRKILDQIEDKITAVGEETRIFPYDGVTIHLVAPDGERRAILEKSFVGENRLKNAVVGKLEGLGCELSPEFKVQIVIEGECSGGSPDEEFWIKYSPASDSAARPLSVKARLIVEKGTATQREYEIDPQERVNLGRLKEVTEKDGGFLRQNQVAFPEDCGDGVNDSVSRTHAHIIYDASKGHFRIYNDSNQGIIVVRHGTRIDVPRGKVGAGLLPDDRIHLGAAVVRFEQTDGQKKNA